MQSNLFHLHLTRHLFGDHILFQRFAGDMVVQDQILPCATLSLVYSPKSDTYRVILISDTRAASVCLPLEPRHLEALITDPSARRKLFSGYFLVKDGKGREVVRASVRFDEVVGRETILLEEKNGQFGERKNIVLERKGGIMQLGNIFMKTFTVVVEGNLYSFDSIGNSSRFTLGSHNADELAATYYRRSSRSACRSNRGSWGTSKLELCSEHEIFILAISWAESRPDSTIRSNTLRPNSPKPAGENCGIVRPRLGRIHKQLEIIFMSVGAAARVFYTDVLGKHKFHPNFIILSLTPGLRGPSLLIQHATDMYSLYAVAACRFDPFYDIHSLGMYPRHDFIAYAIFKPIYVGFSHPRFKLISGQRRSSDYGSTRAFDLRPFQDPGCNFRQHLYGRPGKIRPGNTYRIALLSTYLNSSSSPYCAKSISVHPQSKAKAPSISPCCAHHGAYQCQEFDIYRTPSKSLFCKLPDFGDILCYSGMTVASNEFLQRAELRTFFLLWGEAVDIFVDLGLLGSVYTPRALSSTTASSYHEDLNKVYITRRFLRDSITLVASWFSVWPRVRAVDSRYPVTIFQPKCPFVKCPTGDSLLVVWLGSLCVQTLSPLPAQHFRACGTVVSAISPLPYSIIITLFNPQYFD
ncbi:uncharacterized protein BDR25DRAFT_362198 [Lindgomyces ingoldianus]|uniref:Uncharacterized protein n=1 Tax=Lindgomyces ingoldianus TaxID=673940 RepID=A0ACB6QCW1_9PLEO|nr:uncharacterized protein BDR25DRAFT_362198 [Lindgomyces ingoldianus]KAF2463985.1 hypothetical protein BDR25DRAFT_362198 [Lindgomyces ingoldianus]